MRKYILSLFIIIISLFFRIYGLDYTVSYSYNLPQFSVPIEILVKDFYNAGELLNATIRVYYGYEYYFSDAKLVIQLIRTYDNNSIYPSELADHNIILEEVYNLSLEPGKVYEINFSYKIPEDIENGKYAIVTYLYTPLTYLSGLPFIFLPGTYRYITINGSGNYPYVKINRNLTTINNEPATIGAKSLDKINIKLVLNSKINTTARVIIKYAEWDDITRKSSVLYDNYVILNKGMNYINIEKSIEGLDPGVYSVRVEVYINNVLQSMYRLRFIKIGPTAKIRGILLNGNGDLTVIIGPSPDHYTYPVTKDVWFEVRSGALNYYNKITLGDIEYFTTGFAYIHLKINLSKEEFDLCVNLYSQYKEVDKYCIFYRIPLRKIPEIYQEKNKIIIISPKDGKVMIEDLKNNKSIVYNVSKGENILYLDEGEYIVTFINDFSIEKEFSIYKPIEEKILDKISNAFKNPEIFTRFLIAILIIILVIIIYMMVKLLTRGKKEVMYAVLFVLFVFTFLLSLGRVYSLIDISNNNFCSVYGKINITTNNTELEEYQVFVELYNESYSFNITYECRGYCLYTLDLPSLEPNKTYVLNVSIIDKGEIIENKTFVLKSLYPYDISLLTNEIYEGAYAGIKISPVSECKDIEGYNQTLFNITYDSVILRVNCPYSGDPDWGENICGIDTTTLKVGSYNLYADYYFGDRYFNQFIGTLKVSQISSGVFIISSCSHGWSMLGQGVQYNISIKGRYAVDEGMYVIPKGSTLTIYNIGYINYMCSNGVYSQYPARLAAFVYKSLTNKPLINYSYGIFVGGSDNMGNFYSKELGNIMKEIYEDKSTYGFAVMISNPSQSFDVYTFNESGYYTVYVNGINAFCDSPLNFICPSDRLNNLCNIGEWKNKPAYYIGWYRLGEHTILVPDPKVEGSYVDKLVIHPYYSYSDGKWYAYIVDYFVKDYNNYLDINLVTRQPLSYIKIGKFRNIGLGKVKVEAVNGYIYKYVNISQGSESPLFIDIEKYVLELCKNKNCTIKYNLSYKDAYGFYEKEMISDPIIEVRWVEIDINEIPGYLDGIVLVVRFNITNKNSYVEAQNISVREFVYDKNCIKILPSKTITVPPGESDILEVPIVFIKTTCPPNSYNTTFTISGINTEEKIIQLNVLEYYRKSVEIYLTKGKMVVSEKINLILIILLIMLLFIINY